jgi:hypothetical protein
VRARCGHRPLECGRQLMPTRTDGTPMPLPMCTNSRFGLARSSCDFAVGPAALDTGRAGNGLRGRLFVAQGAVEAAGIAPGPDIRHGVGPVGYQCVLGDVQSE